MGTGGGVAGVGSFCYTWVTMFKSVESKPDFPKLEEKILEFWKKNKVFEKSFQNRQGGEPFVFYEGPPTANGKPGIHHVLARAFKDLFPRYKTMQGFYCQRKGGWDTHGLPVELEVEKELGLSGKKQIEDYGIAKFNQKCKESVFRYVEDWEKLTERIGFWIDLDHPYITLDNEYIESCWWILKQLWERGLLVQDYKVVPYCPRCGTPLSSHEVAQGYEDVTEPSVYVKFELKDEPGTFLLAWTTTPWTLPGNVALAVNPDAVYVIAKFISRQEQEHLILAKSRLAVLDEPYEIVEEFKGQDLVGQEYEPLYDFVKYKKKAHYIVPADFVSLDEGTGIVHTAVMYGEEDFDLGEKVGLPKKHLVKEDGTFIDESGQFAGMFVKDTDPKIIKNLDERGFLYKKEMTTHAYPFCWRCHNPLLYYAYPTWFIKTTDRQKEIIQANEETNWYPSHIKKGRMGNWLETMVDWALSRSRYWGTPLPVWQCADCGHQICIGSLEELERVGIKNKELRIKDLDLHRPYIDGVVLKCPKCSGEMTRVLDVIDTWFDSGAMPVAQQHYPFENGEKFKRQFPADFIAEAMDQTRGWFYTLLAESTLLFGKNSYKNVICSGLVLDEKGQKMSKHIGNVVDPWEVIERTGADAVRWYFYSSTGIGNDYRFSAKLVEEVNRRFFMILWNCYKFFTIYANVDGWEPVAAEFYSASDGRQHKVLQLQILDHWILSRLNQLIKIVTDSLDNYDAFAATRAIEDFVVNDLSTWYIRRSRDRVGPTAVDRNDKPCLAGRQVACYQTLHYVLLTLTKLLAPFVPFLAEDMYQGLALPFARPGLAKSVHLTDWPEVDDSLIDEGLEDRMALVREIVEKGHAARKEAGIKVRQPLAKIMVAAGPWPAETWRAKGSQLQQLIKDELNIKRIEFVEGEGDLEVDLDTTLTPELQAEGEARELVRQIQNQRKKIGCQLNDQIVVEVPSWPEGFTDYIKQKTLTTELKVGPVLKAGKFFI
jgi:isoleucyl-tRNA synthetase